MKAAPHARPFLVALLFLPALLAADQKAKTESGREVILHDDGTWTYTDAPKAEPPREKKGEAPKEYARDKRAVLDYTGKKGNFVLYLVPGVWTKVDKPASPAAEVQFVHKDGEAWAQVIAERIAVPMPGLRAKVIDNWKKSYKNTRIVGEEKRVVNGKELLCLTAQFESGGIPFTFHAYLYTGKEGTFQLVTWTGQNLFEEMKPELEACLNGFTATEKK